MDFHLLRNCFGTNGGNTSINLLNNERHILFTVKIYTSKDLPDFFFKLKIISPSVLQSNNFKGKKCFCLNSGYILIQLYTVHISRITLISPDFKMLL